MSAPLPVVPYLKIPADGAPYLEGHKCGACGATFLGERSNCSKCGARDQMTAVKLPNKGKLYSYSIVHRSFPGIEVPYVSAVVDLEDGTAVKGNPDQRRARPGENPVRYARGSCLRRRAGPKGQGR